jgi:hypothetical protein
MQTDELIAFLADGLAPAPRRWVGRHLALALGVGLAASAVVMLLTVGPRPDLAQAMAGGMFWLKLSYVLALGSLGLWMVERQARAGADISRPAAWLFWPVAILGAVSAVALTAPDADLAFLILGSSAAVCPFLILMLAAPLLLCLLAVLRRLAPTQLTLAGASAGLAAGGWAASVYTFHCPESAAPFILVWYSLGIALSALLGAGLGRISLRW